MTPYMLLGALKAELSPVLAQTNLLSGKTVTVFEQIMPPRKEDKDTSHFPFCRIELGDGRDAADLSTQDVVLVFGVHDKDANYQGYRDVMNLIQGVREHLLKFPEIAGRFEVQKPIEWAIPTDAEAHPFYYGAMLLRFSIPRIERENQFI